MNLTNIYTYMDKYIYTYTLNVIIFLNCFREYKLLFCWYIFLEISILKFIVAMLI